MACEVLKEKGEKEGSRLAFELNNRLALIPSLLLSIYSTRLLSSHGETMQWATTSNKVEFSLPSSSLISRE